ncbi:AMP_1a_G0000140.mRNA.1.CDS.1 [Saccharomyces cerevisiae]|nr:AMP_1a_G0000140.mRNA.1.CDS.1 [Saccharomyces cerevisiae]CAI6466405.1 AMP_1a_G0000140.mRNA.1.CDS.1 [Saccharomyces cerevisiae]
MLMETRPRKTIGVLIYLVSYYPKNATLEMTGYFYHHKQVLTRSGLLRSMTLQFYQSVVALRSNVVHKNNLQLHRRILQSMVLSHGKEVCLIISEDCQHVCRLLLSAEGCLLNAVSWGTLPISVELPDGTTVSDDFEGYVYSFDDDLSQSNCTIPDPSKHTTSIVTTTTELWTGTFTSTSTEVTTVTGTNGQPTNETVIVAKTPTTATSFSLSSSSSEQITISITS